MRQAVELDMTQAVKPVAAQMPRIRTLPAGECRFWPTAIALRRRAQYNPTPAPGITIATARNRKHPRQFQSHWPAMRSSAKMCPSRTSGIRNQPSAYRAAPKPKNNVHTITNARTNVGLQPSRKAMPLHTPPIHRSSPRTSPLDRTQVKKRRDVLFFADQAAAVADMDSRLDCS